MGDQIRMPLVAITFFILKFPYNERSDWLKQCALSENRARVDGKLPFKIFALKFWQIWAKLNIPCDSYKRSENELFAGSKYGSRRPLLAIVVLNWLH